MYLPPLPADADDAARLAHASFASIALLVLPTVGGSTLHPDGAAMMKRQIAEMYGQVDTPGARWIRDTFVGTGARDSGG